jgi:hypothetical protein
MFGSRRGTATARLVVAQQTELRASTIDKTGIHERGNLDSSLMQCIAKGFGASSALPPMLAFVVAVPPCLPP